MCLKYKPLDKIPHNIIPKIVEKFMPFEKHPIIVGSYRRETPYSGDIDILYNGSDLNKLLSKLSELHKDRWTVYSKGEMKIAGIFHLSGKKCVEIDLWICDSKNKHAMLLYSTGSKNFNIIMRMIAKRKGYKLNQYGLFKDDKLIETKSEKDIFDKIGMKYREPTQRS
jgi:DNA polymerase (family 10)